MLRSIFKNGPMGGVAEPAAEGVPTLHYRRQVGSTSLRVVVKVERKLCDARLLRARSHFGHEQP